MLRGTRPSPMAKSNGRSSRVACPDDDRAPRRHVMADRRSEKEVLTLSHAMTVQYGWSCLRYLTVWFDMIIHDPAIWLASLDMILQS